MRKAARTGRRRRAHSRYLARERRELGLELVVHDEHGELGALRGALALGQALELALDVLLELGHGVAVGGRSEAGVARTRGGGGRVLLEGLTRVVHLVLGGGGPAGQRH